jgi:hypothetical protein
LPLFIWRKNKEKRLTIKNRFSKFDSAFVSVMCLQARRRFNPKPGLFKRLNELEKYMKIDQLHDNGMYNG